VSFDAFSPNFQQLLSGVLAIITGINRVIQARTVLGLLSTWAY